MLAARQRLRRRSDFTAAIRDGRRARRGCLVIHRSSTSAALTAGAQRAHGGPLQPARAGFVIPRAIGTAVVRNKVRRRLRHLLRDRLGRLPAGTDLVVRVLPGAPGRSFAQLATDLAAAISGAGGPAREREFLHG